MNKTRILDREEWPLVANIMRDEFHNSMPVEPDQSTFLAVFDGSGQVKGFVHVETLFHVNCVYVAPPLRNTRLAWRMMNEVDALMQQMKGHSAIVLTDKPHVARMMPRLGMRDLGQLKVFRKDY